MDHQFTHSNTKRRASVVHGSVGKAGLFVPQDFFPQRNSPDEEANVNNGNNQETRPLLGAAGDSHKQRNKLYDHELLEQERDLLKHSHYPIPSGESDGEIMASFEDAVLTHRITTNSWIEFVALTKSALPLVLTFLLECSFGAVSVFSVGHLGATELAAASLGSMTANISGYATTQGIATALDTLCPQAFGAEKYHLVGAYLQKCITLTSVFMVPVLLAWVFWGYELVSLIVPDESTARLASSYLLYIAPGLPAYILFECGKRFLQAQGIYHISTIVLFVSAPLNAVMNILLVKHIGYLGAPIAVAINYWLMCIGLFLSTIYLVKAESTPSGLHPLVCWGGFDIREAFSGWSRLIPLAIPGLIMLVAEFLYFELMTLMASYLGTVPLAAQSIGSTVAALTYQIPYAIGIAGSTRIANFLGAGLPNAAQLSTKVCLTFGTAISAVNFLFLYFFRRHIALLFTPDERVISTVTKVMWLIALMQVSDGVNANSAGCLRGQGRTKIGGVVNLISYYAIGLPFSYYLTFKSVIKGKLDGLWLGCILALTLIGSIQSYYALTANYTKLSKEVTQRVSHDARA